MASAAAALFVKNDASDICWWIAYHNALGFDALLVFDDNSNDGTWELIQAAAGILPIEAHRVDSKAETYQQRRSESYRQAILTSESRFDWMICLESDEYVHLENAESVGVFLDRFSDADGVELHWSNFGSNGHEKHPLLSPLEAYTRRAPLEFEAHKLGKAFLRPEALAESTLGSLNAIDWELNATRHVASDGSLFEPLSEPRWQEARILHYVARSRAHYESRLKHLPTSMKAPDLWSAYDRNDEEDVAGRRFLAATKKTAARIASVRLNTLFWELKNRIADAQDPFRIPSDFAVGKRSSQPDTDRFKLAAIAPPEDQTSLIEPSQADETLYLLSEEPIDKTQDRSVSRRGLLIATCKGQITTWGNPVLTTWQPVIIEPLAQKTKKSPLQCRIRSAVTDQFYGYEGQTPLSEDPGKPTQFTLVEKSLKPELATLIRPYVTLRCFGDQLNDFCRGIDLLIAPHPDAFACALAHLAPQAQRALCDHYPGAVPLWLKRDDPLPAPKPLPRKELKGQQTVE